MKVYLTCLILAIMSMQQINEVSAAPLTIERDGVKATWGEKNWLDIEVDKVPFSNYSEIWVVNKAWNYYYYGYSYDKGILNSAVATATSITVPLKGEYEEFIGEQTIELLPDRVLRNTIKGKMTTQTVARLNYVLASVQPGWIAGCGYRTISKDGTTSSGIFPTIAPRLNLETAVICKDIKSMEIDSKLGLLTISCSGDYPISCLDYRNNAWDNPDYHMLIGVPDYWYESIDEQKLCIEIKFPPKKLVASEKNRQVTVDAEKKDLVMTEDAGWDVILPTPKHIEWGNGSYGLNSAISVGIMVDDDFTSISEIAKRLEGYGSRKGLRIGNIENAKSNHKPFDVIFKYDSNVTHNDGYTVSVSEKGAVITFSSVGGADNAEKTLRQLLRFNKNKVSIKYAEISDYPTLPFRGIHCFTGKDALDVQQIFFEKLFPLLKINNVVYECSYLQWESMPVLRDKVYGMSIADVRKVIAMAKQQWINLTPMVNTYGHCEWLLHYPETKELADDPDKIYAYDATNPKVYDICERIYDECIKLFNPKMIHIGHDEIQGRDFPKRVNAKIIGAAKLILDDTLHWHSFLKERGIRTMMWGDMLLYLKESPDACHALSSEDAIELRNKLPKDIVISDWHYAPAVPAAYKSLNIFNKAGFNTLAAPWNTPENMVNFTQEATTQNALDRQTTEGQTLGTLQTTWAGYNLNRTAIKGARQQFACYVLAAELSWNGATVDSDLLPYGYQNAFTRLYGDSILPEDERSGWIADLSGPVTLNKLGLKSTKRAQGSALERFGIDTLNGTALSDCFGMFQDTPESVVLNVNDKASKVVFIATVPTGGSKTTPIAESIITYADETTDTIKWLIGKNVLPLNDHRDTPDLPTLARYVGKDGNPSASIHGYVWEAKPEKTISTIDFRSTKTGPSIILYTVIGLK